MHLQHGLVPAALGTVTCPCAAVGSALEHDDQECLQGERCHWCHLARCYVCVLVQLDCFCPVRVSDKLENGDKLTDLISQPSDV
jgi:hypothetical protein